MKFLPWKKDTFASKNGYLLIYDKLEHFIRDAVVSFIFGLAAALIFNIVWEWVDGTRPWAMGSDIEGFSFKDFLAGLAGALLVFIFTTRVGSFF